MTHATPFLMFNDSLGPAVQLYTTLFPNSKVVKMAKSEKDGVVRSAEFIIAGQRFLAYAGGPRFKFSEGFSIFISCEDQREVDQVWDGLVNAGATPSRCGWISDPFGLSWQIVPKRFMELMADPNPKKSQAVMAAMLQMSKFDVAELERAHANA